MRSPILRRFVTLLLTLALVLGTAPPFALAELIGTETLLEQQARQQDLDRVERFLARDEVRRQLESLGVDPADARLRVAGLSDAELARLAQAMDQQPAGGVLAVLGVVLVVLMVLEMLGVTNVFTRL
ncbi:MAG: PA2779 family protein [Candidatus Competibacterales bacterium]|nr:PA2779 family protein [Candidatus Competibacterales bacterium]